MALAVETEDLGIAAGPQDRYAQAHEGLVLMDFAGAAPQVTRLDTALLPALFLAWRTDAKSYVVLADRDRDDGGAVDPVEVTAAADEIVLRVTGGTKTQASARLPPAAHMQPNSWTTSVTSSVTCARWPLRRADTSVGSDPSAEVMVAGSTRSQKGARPTTRALVSTSASGVPSSLATVVGAEAGVEDASPEQPASTRTSTRTSPRAGRRSRR